MNGKITIDTAMIGELVDTLKGVVTYFDTSFKPALNESSKILRELGLFSSGLNIVSSQVDSIEEKLCNASIIVMKHKENSENTFSEIIKYIDSFVIDGDNSVNSIQVVSNYDKVKLSNITYSKKVESTNNNNIPDVNSDFNTTVNYTELENINDNQNVFNSSSAELKENYDELLEKEV